MADALIAEVERLLDEISSLFDRRFPQPPKDQLELDPLRVQILSMFWRARALFEAARVLIRERFVEEALVLGRPLFTESLWLQELAAVDEQRRAALVLGWANESIGERRRLLAEGVRLGFHEEDVHDLKVLSEQGSKLQRGMKRYGVKRLARFDDEKTLAERHERREKYWSYLMSHQMVHGSEVAQSWRRRRLGSPDSMAFFMRSSDVGLIAGVATFIGSAILHAFRGTMTAVGLDFDATAVEKLLLRTSDLDTEATKEAGT